MPSRDAPLLAGRSAFVTGRESGFGRELALGLEDLGASIATEPPLDLVVHADLDEAALQRQALAETAAEDWDRRCEAVLQAALQCAQSAFTALRGRGLLVFVTPTVGITGAPELVPYAAAVEGIRALAKSAARQWGHHGIRVNCVAPPVELLAPDAGRLGPDVADRALADAPTVRDSVASVIALLAAPGSVVTGTTIVVDGGVVMAP